MLSVLFVAFSGGIVFLAVLVVLHTIAEASWINFTETVSEEKNAEPLIRYVSSHKRLNRFLLSLFSVLFSLAIPLCLLIYLAIGLFFVDVARTIHPYFLLLALVFFAGIVVTVQAMITARHSNPGYMKVDRTVLPELWNLTDKVAVRLDTTAISAIRLYPANEMAVSTVKNPAGKGKSADRVLHIGMVSLLSLSTDELENILYHEYGHFVYGDPKLYDAIKLVGESATHILRDTFANRLAFKLNPVFWIIYYFRIVFNRFFLAYSRANEYLADYCAVRMSGSDAFIKSMEKFLKTGVILQSVQNRIASNYYANTSSNVENPYRKELFHRELTQEEQKELTKIYTEASDKFDSHPVFEERKRFAGLFGAGVARKGEPHYINVEMFSQYFRKKVLRFLES